MVDQRKTVASVSGSDRAREDAARQEPRPPDARPPNARPPDAQLPTLLAHCTLAVRDVQRSSDFFQQTLGWRPIRRPGNIHRNADWLQIAPGQELHLLEVPDFEASRFEREFGRHIALTCPLPEFAALKERLAALGAELIPPIRETPFERFFFRSPDGYVFEVMAAGHVSEST